MPDDLNVWMVLRKAPPLPFLPEAVHGKGMVALALCYAGNPAEGEKLIQPLRGFGKVLGERHANAAHMRGIAIRACADRVVGLQGLTGQHIST